MHTVAMAADVKASQLQIRVSDDEKRLIQMAATRAGLDMSSYVLQCVLSATARQFADAVAAVGAGNERLALAELNSLLANWTAQELRDAVREPPETSLDAYNANYVAALVETACARLGIPAPAWTSAVSPLSEPVFGSNLRSLRLHLLTQSPAPFRRRNIFIDSSVGDRV